MTEGYVTIPMERYQQLLTAEMTLVLLKEQINATKREEAPKDEPES